MFVIFGSSRRQKGFDIFVQDVCGRCHNPNNMQLVEISHWFSLFFIPIFKMMREFYLVCPHCGAARKIPNKDGKELIKRAKEGQAPATNKNVRAENVQVSQPQQVTENVSAPNPLKTIL